MRATLVQYVEMFYCWAASPLFYAITSCTLHPARSGENNHQMGGCPIPQCFSPAGAALSPAPWVPEVRAAHLFLQPRLRSEHPRCSRPSPLSSQGVHAWAAGVNTATPHPSSLRPSIPSSLHPPPRGEGKPRCWQARAGFICFT